MSWQAVQFVIENSSQRLGAHHVLLVIAHHVNNDTGYAWPSIRRIARICGMHHGTVARLIRALEQAGELERDLRPGKTTRYRLVGFQPPNNLSGGRHANPPTNYKGVPPNNLWVGRPNPPAKHQGVPPNNLSGVKGNLKGKGLIEEEGEESMREQDDQKRKWNPNHWDITKDQLEIQLDRGNYDTWIMDTRLIDSTIEEIDGKRHGRFVVECRNHFAVDNLTHRLYRTCTRVLRDVALLDQVTIQFVAREEGEARHAGA